MECKKADGEVRVREGKVGGFGGWVWRVGLEGGFGGWVRWVIKNNPTCKYCNKDVSLCQNASMIDIGNKCLSAC